MNLYLQELISATSCNITGLFKGNEYEFRVAAENNVGIGEFSLPSQYVTASKPMAVPSAPCNLAVKDLNANSVKITWNQPL